MKPGRHRPIKNITKNLKNVDKHIYNGYDGKRHTFQIDVTEKVKQTAKTLLNIYGAQIIRWVQI